MKVHKRTRESVILGKIVSFYTEEYSGVVKNLISSLKRFNLSYDIEKRKSLGSWLKNTNQKPRFILEKLKQYNNIIWLDADAIVRRYPTYFDLIEEDIAVNYRNGRNINAGTIVFKKSALGLVEDWVRRTEEQPNTVDQKHLQNVINDYQIDYKLSVFYLPDTYCYISGVTRLGDPVIFQTQESRKRR